MVELKTEINSFIHSYEEKISFGKKLLKSKITNPEILNQQIENWQNDLIEFLKENIPSIPDKLTDLIKYTDTDSYITRNFREKDFKRDKTLHIKYLKGEIKKKEDQSYIVRDYLTVTDTLRNNNSALELNNIQEKVFFILSKLYKLYNDNFYSISLIFDLNKIDYRQDEPKEIADDLKRRGYCTKISDYSDSDLIKISVKGASYVERKMKTVNNKKKKKSESDLNEKIDFVLSKLEKLGYGQEIIFNEIEELRTLSKKLSKKTFSQLIKGKVMDLALSSLINKETASFIYETLVDDKLKLLK